MVQCVCKMVVYDANTRKFKYVQGIEAVDKRTGAASAANTQGKVQIFMSLDSKLHVWFIMQSHQSKIRNERLNLFEAIHLSQSLELVRPAVYDESIHQIC